MHVHTFMDANLVQRVATDPRDCDSCHLNITPTDHTCLQGPICAEMAANLADELVIAEMATDPMNDYAGFVPELPEPEHQPCGHNTCLVLVYYDECPACMAY
jgi:hypothetical protein